MLEDSSDSDEYFNQLEATPLIEKFSFLDRSRGSNSKTSDIFDTDKFTSYLIAAESKNEDVARRIANDVVKFFNTVPHGSNAKYTDIILNTSSLLSYIHDLRQQNLAPSTIIDKLRNLRLVIEYIISEENATMSNVELSRKCEETNKWIQKRAKNLRKDVRLQKFANAIKGEQAVDNADNPGDFFSDPDVKGRVNEILDVAETRELCNDEHRIVIAYLAAKIMYKNTQRPGVVENMTITELMPGKTRRMERY